MNITPKEFVTQLFERWEHGDIESFFDALSEDVHWTAIGHTPIFGSYTSKAEYFEKVYRPIMDQFSRPVQCQVRHIIASQVVMVTTS